MHVHELMSTDVETVRLDDNLNRATQIMWERDCGSVPVLDAESRVVGMLTDRDVCIAAYTQGLPLSQIPVSSACAHIVQSCKMSDSLQTAENIMGAAQIHRLPVVDDDGKLRGIVSLGDLAQHVHRPGRRPNGLSYESVARTLAAISLSPSANGKTAGQTHPR
jgi:CBS-domain-containing membrane protein